MNKPIQISESIKKLRNPEAFYIAFLKEALASAYNDELKSAVKEILEQYGQGKKVKALIKNGGLLALLEKNVEPRWVDAVYELAPESFKNEEMFAKFLHAGPVNAFNYFVKENTWTEVESWLRDHQTAKGHMVSAWRFFDCPRSLERLHSFQEALGCEIYAKASSASLFYDVRPFIALRTTLNEYVKNRPYLKELLHRFEQDTFKDTKVDLLILETPREEQNFYLKMAIQRFNNDKVNVFSSNALLRVVDSVNKRCSELARQIEVFRALQEMEETQDVKTLIGLVGEYFDFNATMYAPEELLKPLLGLLMETHPGDEVWVRKVFEHNPNVLPSSVLDLFKDNEEVRSKIQQHLLKEYVGGAAHLTDKKKRLL